MSSFLRDLRAGHLSGRRGGVFSVCSSHPEVLAAAVCYAREEGIPLLIEATAAQVNPQGGYSGMTPADFSARLAALAEGLGLGRENLVLGADHLGPYVWREKPSAEALARAAELARHCVAAGFQKLHIDASAACRDDPPPAPDPQTAARRTALLCRMAEEEAARRDDGAGRPLYVIGSDVPPPGGRPGLPREIKVTRPEQVAEFLSLVKEEFRRQGIEDAWERILAVVVQPGVDFGHEGAAPYRPGRAAALSGYHAALPGIMTYEVHSTDYQSPESLARLVADHFTILKVGPCLTDAFREAVFHLEELEIELARRRPGLAPSGLRSVLLRVMQEDPAHWREYYRGSEEEIRELLLSSRLDRVRYYWARPEVEAALTRLFANLSPAIPEEWIVRLSAGPSDRAGELPRRLTAADWVRRRIQAALRPYREACR
ncbi:MAG: class II D-tagatose-bisphosphate aldolase, non-catalytic subunit [Desulfobacterales bacterium]